MLAALKSLLKGLLAPTLYFGVLCTFPVGIFRRAEWPLLLLALFAPIPTLWYPLQQFPLGNSTLDLLFASCALGIVVNKGGFDRSRSGLVIAQFIAVAFISLMIVFVRFDLPVSTSTPALQDWKNYVEMILLYFLAHNALKSEKDQKRMLVLMASVILLVAFREFRNFSERSSFSYESRVEGPFWLAGLGANHFAAFIAHFGILFFGMFLVDNDWRRRLLYLGTCLFSLHPLFFAYSRGAWMATLAALLIFGLIRTRIILVLLVALALTWQVVLPVSVVDRIQMTEQPDGHLESSAAERLEIWAHAKQIFLENVATGVGFTGFRIIRTGYALSDTHNYYMKVAADQGLMGLMSFTLVLLAAFLSGWNLYRRARTPFHRGIGFGFMGCVVAEAVTNLFGDRFSYFAVNAYFFIAWGVADRALRLSAQPEMAPAAVSLAEAASGVAHIGHGVTSPESVRARP